MEWECNEIDKCEGGKEESKADDLRGRNNDYVQSP